MTEERWTEALGRTVTLRGLPDSNDDGAVWDATFNGLHHVPPAEMLAPSTVLDLGANIGLTCAHYRALWPAATVVGVEMDEANAEAARANAPGAAIANCAVAGVAGSGSYSLSEHTARFRLGPVVPGAREVAVLSLREIILGWFGGYPADFVKMDVEGSEWEILEHAADWAPLVRHLLVELHGEGQEQADYDRRIGRACELLHVEGFAVRAHDAHPCAVWAWR